MKHVPDIIGTTPTPDAAPANRDDVSVTDPDERVTDKLARYLDLLDSEMAERWANKSAA